MNSFIYHSEKFRGRKKKGGKKRSRKDNTLILGRARHVVYQSLATQGRKSDRLKNTIYLFFLKNTNFLIFMFLVFLSVFFSPLPYES